MDSLDTLYFFETIEKDSKVLPQDLRTLEKYIKESNPTNYSDLKKLIDEIFFKGLQDNEIKAKIHKDIKDIVYAILNNEECDTFDLISISRFSLAFKLNTKILKIGFPKITYKFPNSDIVLDSIIRKQYKNSNDIPILFVEVQDYKENNLRKEYTEEEIEELIYQLWKELRKQNIVWYDPKDKNIVLNKEEVIPKAWNDKYYKRSSEEEKGRYKLYDDRDSIDYICDVLIIDTDLFLPLETVEKLMKMYKIQPSLPGFKNWKFKKMLKYEKRFLEEQEYEKI